MVNRRKFTNRKAAELLATLVNINGGKTTPERILGEPDPVDPRGRPGTFKRVFGEKYAAERHEKYLRSDPPELLYRR